jgi:hypothetical protein
MRLFEDNPSNAPEKQVEYKAKLQAMSDNDLYKETKDKIWFSAYASNNPRSCFHWQCDATYDEWQRRKGNTNEYRRAHKEVMTGCGY